MHCRMISPKALKQMKTDKAPFIAISRHRMTVDGDGVTTLVCFYGCPLRCKYCINPQSFSEETKPAFLTPEELYGRVKLDELYFLATGGGVTFGGGEPLLYPEFLEEFRQICGEKWHLCAETSLNVPRENLEKAAQCIDYFIVDVKDTNPDVYLAYTGKTNEQTLSNLKLLVSLVGADNIIVRLPLIKDYNDDLCRDRSEKLLRDMGITQFDKFTYIIKEDSN